MYSAELLDHFSNPRNAGELPAPARTVEVMNPVCGDILRLSILWDDAGRVARAGFQARGCTASIAAASALTELIAGRSRAELASFRKSELEQALGGLPPESGHAASLCVDALRAALK